MLDTARLPLIRIAVQEPLDLATVRRYELLLDDALDCRPDVLEVDLSGCDFLDAGGLDVVLGAHRRARAQGGRLVLTHLTARHRRLVALVGLTHVLEVAA